MPQLYATDSLIPRNRSGRRSVFIAYIAITCVIPALGWILMRKWFDQGLIGLFLGLAAQVWVLSRTLDRFIVKVGALRAFITVDQLKTFLNGNGVAGEADKEAYVSYGPGLHLSYPWEARSANYNVSLEEVSETFSVDVQTAKGTLSVKGSVRMRPDITKLVPFIGGVAAIASDITDLIKAFVIEIISQARDDNGEQSIVSILESSKKFTEKLTRKFAHGVEGRAVDPQVSDFEAHFGVSVTDVTIAELLPSKELQKTMTGISEAEIIAKGAAITAGYKDAEEARQAIKDGRLTQADLNQARDRFMAASDNISMDLKSNEYKLQLDGITPELVKAFTEAGPALTIIAKALGDKKGK